MKKIILMAFLLFPFPSLVSAQPEARFSELHYDFSTIGQQDEVVHVFSVTNIGDRDLVINEVSAS